MSILRRATGAGPSATAVGESAVPRRATDEGTASGDDTPRADAGAVDGGRTTAMEVADSSRGAGGNTL
ncbi:MAG: hypothetical protein O3A28_00565 [Actinomycetota bacterium]|nr:hypothetical protein [Ilumatobacteraceae bacterium]MDA2958980.1 hypothetical protein [Actinomycetota bacterium]MDA3006294.1 hypothetical protein [Actinomycetota bacterium]MDA3033506.1 hypothetical protein [Actinomycetota bacterium]